MRILIFTDAFKTGGLERRLSELIAFLFKNKIDFKLVCLHNIFEYDLPLEVIGSTVVLNKRFFLDVSVVTQFCRVVKEYNPTVINTWTGQNTMYAIPAKLLYHKPLINSQIANSPPWYRTYSILGIFNKINFIFSDLIISNSKAGLKTYDAPLNKSRVIYNGVSLERFIIKEERNDLKKALGIKTRFCIVMVGSFTPNKDFYSFVKVAKIVCDLRKDVSFLAVGDGPNFNSIVELSQSLNLERLYFLGKRTDISKILSACDIGVLISPNGEGISNAILEYMGSSLPVIANDSGGTSEIVVSHRNGFLIPSPDAELFARSILELLESEIDLRNYGLAGREFLEKNFMIDRMAKEFITEYEKYSKAL